MERRAFILARRHVVGERYTANTSHPLCAIVRAVLPVPQVKSQAVLTGHTEDLATRRINRCAKRLEQFVVILRQPSISVSPRRPPIPIEGVPALYIRRRATSCGRSCTLAPKLASGSRKPDRNLVSPRNTLCSQRTASPSMAAFDQILQTIRTRDFRQTIVWSQKRGC